MRPPADDSHKWFISVLATKNCRYCDNLKRDFATSDHLKPFVDVEDHTQSWAHFNVYSNDDATQAWREVLAGFERWLAAPPEDRDALLAEFAARRPDLAQRPAGPDSALRGAPYNCPDTDSDTEHDGQLQPSRRDFEFERHDPIW
mgnify:CR=1 FL=1